MSEEEGSAPSGRVGDLSLLADDAITDRSQDRLGRQAFADRMVDLLDHVAEQTESAVFGLLGPWGSGKTSVLQLVRDSLHAGERWTVVEFNPWELSDLPTLTREFLTTLDSAVKPERMSEKVRHAFAGYIKKVSPLGSLISVAGVDVPGALGGVASLLDGERSLEQARKEVVDVLREQATPVLVLVDDVDRLQADELATILKLVRLVGRLPHIFYVLAYDEATLLSVLNRTDVAGTDPKRALAYLDKIVQVRLDLPPVHPTAVTALVNEALAGITARYDVELTQGEASRLSTMYHEHLIHYLGEPRQVKRYFGQVDAFYALIHEEVDFVDFLLITFLRTTFPAVYRMLRAHKAELTGTAFELSEKPTPEQRVAAWRERIGAVADSNDAEHVLGVLADLFLPLAYFKTRMSPGSWQYTELAETRRVGSSEYFDRYLYLTVPVDDISDAEVRLAIGEVLTSSRGERTDALIARTATAGEAVLDKLARFAPTTPAEARRLLPFAAEMLPLAPETGLLARPRTVARIWFSEMFAAADVSEPETLLDELLVFVSFIDVVGAIRTARHRSLDSDAPLDAAHERFATVLATRLQAELGDIHEAPTTDGSIEVAGELLYGWRTLSGSEAPRAWLRAAIEGGRWELGDAVALFMSVSRVIGSNERRLSGVHIDMVDELLGLDFLFDHLTPDPDDGTIDWDEETDVSFEERRRRAHAVLARTAAERAAE
jgi:hypothetical protein